MIIKVLTELKIHGRKGSLWESTAVGNSDKFLELLRVQLLLPSFPKGPLTRNAPKFFHYILGVLTIVLLL